VEGMAPTRVSVSLCVAALWLALPAAGRADTVDWHAVSDEAIEKLRAYIRIDTTNPPGNETPAAALLLGWLQSEGIEARLYDPLGDPSRQALVARLPGTSGKTIVLMSHSDVVGAVAGEWSHPPFAADLADGEVFGRGTLDTKGLGIMEIMTVLLLHRQGLAPRDEILLLIEPDEEDGGRGVQGMLDHHADLFSNVRMVLNEGGSGTLGLLKPGQVIFFVQTAEKGVAWMKLRAHGDGGHGSVPLPNNAVATMARALGRIAAYQTPLKPAHSVVVLFNTLADQLSFPNSFVMRHVDNPIVQTMFRPQLTERPLINALLRTTISLTGVHGGFKTNVIPTEVEATLDCRVTVGDTGEALRAELTTVVDDPRVQIELTTNGVANESPIDEPLMATIRDVTSRYILGSLVAPLMSSGGTDSAVFRARGMRAYGFVPLVLTEDEMATMHGANERVRVDRLGAAVQMYYEVVAALAGAANAPGAATGTERM
jgi:acetylornithine deacetylase/succinyl-diaminopimelate desuccinylase-like protein